jgi:hypothetical protein
MKYYFAITTFIAILTLMASNPLDISSFSNLDKVRQQHIDLDLTIDFSIQMY